MHIGFRYIPSINTSSERALFVHMETGTLQPCPGCKQLSDSSIHLLKQKLWAYSFHSLLVQLECKSALRASLEIEDVMVSDYGVCCSHINLRLRTYADGVHMLQLLQCFFSNLNKYATCSPMCVLLSVAERGHPADPLLITIQAK